MTYYCDTTVTFTVTNKLSDEKGSDIRRANVVLMEEAETPSKTSNDC